MFGASVALLASAVVMLLGAVIGIWVRVPEPVTINLAPLNRFREPHLALDVTPRSGPIVIHVEYVIQESDLHAFLDAMAERRRIRRRDGARNWRLMRDLENPELWIESYHTPTWTEYIRYHERTTQADAEIADRLRRLHSGKEPPRVHRLIERPTDWSTSRGQLKGMAELH